MRAVSCLTKITAAATLCLLAAGAMVTSTGSGLAVPDWPLSYGQFFPPMIGGIVFEHGHRMIAGIVAILTLIQAIAIARCESRAWVRLLGFVALGLVLFQASLGGLTVLLRLPHSVSVAHAITAQTFFALVLILAMVTSPSWISPSALVRADEEGGGRLGYFCLAVNAAFYLQLLLGAVMRHTGAGGAIPDFPRSFGVWIPPFVSQAITIHFSHRVGAVLVIVLVVLLAVHIYRHYSQALDLVFLSGGLVALVSIQILLGALLIWLKRPVWLTTTHLAVGALALGSSVLLTVRAFRFSYGHRAVTRLEGALA